MSQGQDYLARLRERFVAGRFNVKSDVPFGNRLLRLVACKTRFSENMNFVEEFFVAAELPALDAKGLQDFSETAVDFARANRQGKPFLARFFGLQLRTFPVALAAAVPPEVDEYLAGSTPVYTGSGIIIPVVVEAQTSALHHFKPSWAARVLLKTVKKWLEPTAGS